jgi:hypothetical protein
MQSLRNERATVAAVITHHEGIGDVARENHVDGEGDRPVWPRFEHLLHTKHPADECPTLVVADVPRRRLAAAVGGHRTRRHELMGCRDRQQRDNKELPPKPGAHAGWTPHERRCHQGRGDAAHGSSQKRALPPATGHW